MQLAALTPDVVTSLPVDRLALDLVRAMVVDSDPATFFHNRESVRRELENGPWAAAAGKTHHQAACAYEEAFAWLQHHGLVAPEPSQSGSDWFFITRRGRDVLADSEGLARLRAAERLNVDLHHLIAERVRAQYLLGEFELAALLALREVEIQVRKRAKATESDIGVKLMRHAFGEKGPLRNPKLDPGEATATMELFAGAIGVFKNPPSHRQVDFNDPTLASEVILLADLLLRMLDGA
jgi:uncharacterized protein (TIGR02391 family)